jgi:replication fork clamp-binding protein CrfC
MANPVLAQAVAIEADLAAAFADEAATIAETIALSSERTLAEYLNTISGLRTAVPGSSIGGVNNITINTPLGSEDVLTETMQRVIQKLNRMGDNLSYAGALP